MRVTLPHDLTKEEVRRRMRAHSGEIADFFPAGLAEVTTDWPHEDRMSITATVLGHTIPGGVDVREKAVVIELKLPLMLSLMKGPLKAAVKQEGRRLLAP